VCYTTYGLSYEATAPADPPPLKLAKGTETEPLPRGNKHVHRVKPQHINKICYELTWWRRCFRHYFAVEAVRLSAGYTVIAEKEVQLPTRRSIPIAAAQMLAMTLQYPKEVGENHFPLAVSAGYGAASVGRGSTIMPK
jgi:hypothetical protein